MSYLAKRKLIERLQQGKPLIFEEFQSAKAMLAKKAIQEVLAKKSLRTTVAESKPSIDDEEKKRAAIRAVANKMSDDTASSSTRPAETPSAETLRDKPNTQGSTADELVKQYNITVDLALPSPEKMGFSHSPSHVNAVKGRTGKYVMQGRKATEFSNDKMTLPKKPAGDTGSNQESGRGYY